MKKTFVFLLLLSLMLPVAATGQQEKMAPQREYFPGYSEANIDWRQHAGEKINILVTNAHYFNKFRAITPEFTELTGIEVTFDVVPPREMRERAVLDLSLNTGNYASHTGDPMFLPLYEANGWIEPFDKYLNNERLTDKEWFNVEDIIPLWRQADSVDGKWVAMPVEGEVTILVYRKDLYDRLGLSVPKNLEELKDNAKKLHELEDNLSGLALRGFRGAGQNMYIYPSLYKAFGGEWFDSKGNAQVNSPEAIAALEYYVEVLNNYAPAGIENWNWPEIMEAFAGGSVAQFIDTNSTASVIENPAKSKVAGKVGYARWPVGPAGTRTTSIWNWAMPINGSLSETEKEATWLYLQWLASKETQLRSALLKESDDDVYRTGVNRFSIWNDPEYQQTLGLPSIYFNVVLDSLEFDTDADWRPRIPEWPDFGETMAIAVQSALVGETTPREALNVADSAIDEMLKK
jgi:multiple sugar transport system substrate-binding protein